MTGHVRQNAPQSRRPQRVQMTRTAPWRAAHPDAVIVARPTRWGNPFPVENGDHAEAVRRFAEHLRCKPHLVREARRHLAGKDLACWCPPGQPCHADVWLNLVNRDVTPLRSRRPT